MVESGADPPWTIPVNLNPHRHTARTHRPAHIRAPPPIWDDQRPTRKANDLIVMEKLSGLRFRTQTNDRDKEKHHGRLLHSTTPCINRIAKTQPQEDPRHTPRQPPVPRPTKSAQKNQHQPAIQQHPLRPVTILPATPAPKTRRIMKNVATQTDTRHSVKTPRRQAAEVEKTHVDKNYRQNTEETPPQNRQTTLTMPKQFDSSLGSLQNKPTSAAATSQATMQAYSKLAPAKKKPAPRERPQAGIITRSKKAEANKDLDNDHQPTTAARRGTTSTPRREPTYTNAITPDLHQIKNNYKNIHQKNQKNKETSHHDKHINTSSPTDENTRDIETPGTAHSNNHNTTQHQIQGHTTPGTDNDTTANTQDDINRQAPNTTPPLATRARQTSSPDTANPSPTPQRIPTKETPPPIKTTSKTSTTQQTRHRPRPHPFRLPFGIRTNRQPPNHFSREPQTKIPRARSTSTSWFATRPTTKKKHHSPASQKLHSNNFSTLYSSTTNRERTPCSSRSTVWSSSKRTNQPAKATTTADRRDTAGPST